MAVRFSFFMATTAASIMNHDIRR